MLNEQFRDEPTFKDNLGIFESKDYKKFKQDVLYKVRNRATFHPLHNTVSNIINTLNFNEYDFALATGETLLDLYYALADQIAINYIIGDNGNDKEDEKKLYEIVTKTTEIAIKFVNSADKFIDYYLTKNNWIYKEVSDK